MSDDKKKVVYWNNIPAPYMVDRFNALVERNNVEFEAWFNQRIESDRSWDIDEDRWKFKYQYVPSIKLFGKKIRFPLILFSPKIDFLVSLHAEPVFIIGWMVARIRGVKTGFRVLKTFDQWVERTFIKESLKKYLFSRVTAIEVPGDDARCYAKKYGADDGKIFHATHTISNNILENKHNKMSSKEHDRLKNQLSLVGVVFLYVGRLWKGKGLQILIEAFEQTQKNCNFEVSLLVLGDGVDECEFKNTCYENGIKNVVFLGFRQREEIPNYFNVSDVFVFPTLGDPYGLVVDEAMASSLPVISSSSAGEITDRIEDGVTGFIVPPENSTALYEKMLILANDKALRIHMGKISASKISDHTPENWAKDFEFIVENIV